MDPGRKAVLTDPRFDIDAQTMTGTLPGVSSEAMRLTAARPEPPEWVEGSRSGLSTPGRYLAFEQDGSIVVVPISREWTRIGRSLAADVRFDDATVSRRHALVANEEAGVRVLDDRSLNGILVNGRRVEWSPLADGDELVIGRHVLYFLDTVGEPISATPVALAE
jgi:pSer/pThr/pTyr-binding forkhead associated (FHA) protein